ncbi:hypothetical protein RhiirA4_453979 [Rhizophagus irregularis]|uniref:Uncharacterized protein n=1 Tax=Rhizophagus irregularis TaxID=588596 RepID=A0A2I1G1R4_9GLOM|nr:hypothetical protein RhiirA4_453979 [Rhizophagus irregularis]
MGKFVLSYCYGRDAHKKNQEIYVKNANFNKYQVHVKISSVDSTTLSEEIDDKIIYMEDLEKRKKVYGISEECNEPGTRSYWYQPCNEKRFKENFKIGLKFQNVTYITRGGFSKINLAEWPEGFISYWNNENQNGTDLQDKNLH